MTFHTGPIIALPAFLFCLLLFSCSPKSGIMRSRDAVRTSSPEGPSETSKRVMGEPVAARVSGGPIRLFSRGGSREALEADSVSGDLSSALSSRSLELLKGSSSSWACSLLSRALETTGKDNVAISPVSLEMVLGMILGGADDAGKQEILGFLGFRNAGKDEVGAYHHDLLSALNAFSGDALKIRLANALWTQTGFAVRKEYLQEAQTFYDATVEQLDFAGDAPASVRRINAWGSEATEGLIPGVIGSIPSSTRMILANATYLKADWESPFDEKRTHKDVFHKADGSDLKTDFMSQTLRTQYAVGDGYSALRLPYVGRDLAMTLVLPDEGKDVSAMTGLLNPSAIPFKSGRVQVEMPKFTFSFSRDLTADLKAMGINRVFSDGSLPLIAPEIGVSQVFQSDFLEVDETGTKAAAVTIGMVSMTSLQEDPVRIRLDRPFLFCISSLKSGCILMMGRVSEPR